MNNMRQLINLMEGVSAVPGIGSNTLNEYIRHDSPLRDMNDYRVRMKELQKIQMNPNTSKDPALKAELTRKKVMLDQEAREMGIISEDDTDESGGMSSDNLDQDAVTEEETGLGVGAKVYPRWSQHGEPFEIVGMTQSGKWVCVDDYGNRGTMSGEDLVMAPSTANSHEDIEAPMEDINNAYDEVHYASGNDYFPNGADAPVAKAVGPSGARQGDNPEQKKMQVAETHKELVYAYRSYLKESVAPKRK